MTGRSRIAVDTSVAIPLLVASHEEHASVRRWASDKTLVLCGHALIETYAVLTRLPGAARVDAADAAIDARFDEPVVLSGAELLTAHRRLAAGNVCGGATYDALVALAAIAHGLTLATRDARARSTYLAIGTRIELLADEQ